MTIPNPLRPVPRLRGDKLDREVFLNILEIGAKRSERQLSALQGGLLALAARVQFRP